MARTMTMTSLDMELLPSMVISLLLPHQRRWEASRHFMEGRDGQEKQDFLWLQRHLEFGDKNFNHTGKDSAQPSHAALPSPSSRQPSLQSGGGAPELITHRDGGHLVWDGGAMC